MLQVRRRPARDGGMFGGPFAGGAAALGVALALIGGLALAVAWAGQAHGHPRLSAYAPARDGSTRLLPAAPVTAAPAPSDLPLLPNPNAAAVPAGVDAATPYGLPVLRRDWMISKDYAAHGGHSNWGAVDIAFAHDYQAVGAALVATHAGRVKLLHDDPTYGNLVYVIGAHFTTTYGHLQRFAVQDGDQVVRGTLLGAMGSTGHSTGPHVDYQVWRDGDNQNPLAYGIPGTQSAGPLP